KIERLSKGEAISPSVVFHSGRQDARLEAKRVALSLAAEIEIMGDQRCDAELPLGKGRAIKSALDGQGIELKAVADGRFLIKAVAPGKHRLSVDIELPRQPRAA